MGLQADAKDVTIAHLAVNLTLQAQRADDAEALVAQLQAELATLKEPVVDQPEPA